MIQYSDVGTEKSSRQLKAGEVIRRALSDIFNSPKLLDVYIGDTPITVSEVRISPDLKNAIVFVIPFGSLERERFMQSLIKIKPTLRKMVASKVKFKSSPDLIFKFDDSYDRADYFEKIFRKTKSKNEKIDAEERN